jgi:hypothetical protein
MSRRVTAAKAARPVIRERMILAAGGDKSYFVAIGRSYEEDEERMEQFTRRTHGPIRFPQPRCLATLPDQPQQVRLGSGDPNMDDGHSESSRLLNRSAQITDLTVVRRFHRD